MTTSCHEKVHSLWKAVVSKERRPASILRSECLEKDGTEPEREGWKLLEPFDEHRQPPGRTKPTAGSTLGYAASTLISRRCSSKSLQAAEAAEIIETLKTIWKRQKAIKERPRIRISFRQLFATVRWAENDRDCNDVGTGKDVKQVTSYGPIGLQENAANKQHNKE